MNPFNLIPAGRYAVALAAAVATTAVLLFIMQLAISRSEVTTNESPPGLTVDFVRLLIDNPPEIIDRRPPKPEKVTPPPPTARLQFAVDTGLTGDYGPLIPVTGPGPIQPGVASAEGDLLPIMTVPPEYPDRLLARGIEGWVLVEFVVDKLGRVRDVIVVDAQPSNVFDRAAIKAVLRYKYKPRVINGHAVDVRGVRQRISFNMT